MIRNYIISGVMLCALTLLVLLGIWLTGGFSERIRTAISNKKWLFALISFSVTISILAIVNLICPFDRHLLKERFFMILLVLLSMALPTSAIWGISSYFRGVRNVSFKRVVAVPVCIFAVSCCVLLGEFVYPFDRPVEQEFVCTIEVSANSEYTDGSWYVVSKEDPGILERDIELRKSMINQGYFVADKTLEEKNYILVFGRQLEDLQINTWDYDEKRAPGGSFHAKATLSEEIFPDTYFVYAIPRINIHA